jgi:hypothetical protein
MHRSRYSTYPRYAGHFKYFHARLRWLRPAHLIGVGLLATVLALSGCTVTGTGTGGTVDDTPTAGSGGAPTATPHSAPTATSTPSGYPVKVYFSKHPDSDNNVNAVFSVNRVSPDLGVAKYSLQQLIAGPTASESASGLYTDLPSSFAGPSNCGGADFQLYPDHKGPTVSSPGTMTVKLCRPTQLAGDLTGARITAEVNKTLFQFSNIHAVVILNSTGHCFNDFQGADACLH